MFTIPPGFLKNDPPKIETKDEQLSQMMASVPKPPFKQDEKFSWIDNIFSKSQKMGISCAYYRVAPRGSDTEREYLIFSTDHRAMKALTSNQFKDFPIWLKRQKFQDRGTVLLDKVVIDITDINHENYFAQNSYIMRYIQNMAIVKTAFENEGYPVPDHVSDYVVSSIWELDQMRANAGVPKALKERYNKTYKEAVADYAHSYATKYRLESIPHDGSHQVKETYFKENHIPVSWDVVDVRFWNFMQSELAAGKYPDFVYYKDEKPFLKTKNLAKEFMKLTKGKNTEGQNFWEKDVGKTKYHICYPTSHETMFCNMRNDYNTRMYENKVSTDELERSSNQPLQTIHVHLYDINNWNKLCRAGNMVWAINDGSYGDVKINTESTLEKIPVLYRAEDKNTVSLIVDRLAREMRDYVPMSAVTRSERTDRALQSIQRAGQKIEAKNKKQDIDVDM